MDITAYSTNIARLAGDSATDEGPAAAVKISDDGLAGSGSYLVYLGQLFGSGDLKGLQLQVASREVTPDQIAWLRTRGWTVEVMQTAMP